MQKLPEPPPLHHKGVFREGWISGIICGKSGCGKTSLLMWLIPQISDVVKVIAIATKVRNVNAHLTIKRWCEQNGKSCFIMDNAKAIQAFIESLQDEGLIRKGADEMLIIFDDFSIYNHSRSEDENLVLRAFTTWRNMGINPIIVCQDITMVDPKCRNCSNFRVLFNTNNRDKVDAFMKDLRNSMPSRDVLDNCMQYLRTVPYSFLLTRDYPTDVAIGSGSEGNNSIRTVMTLQDVCVPTYREILNEMSASNRLELRQKAAEAQHEMGNTADRVEEDM